MILPGIIIAIGTFFFLTRLGLSDTIMGVVLGHTVGSLPLATVVFALPGLTLDAIKCLTIAHDFVGDELRDQTRLTILSLRTAHTTEAAETIAVLRRTAKHLVEVEENLNQTHRHITAEKVRHVRQRVQHLVLS